MAIEKITIANASGNAGTAFFPAVTEHLVPDFFSSITDEGSYVYSFKDDSGNAVFQIRWLSRSVEVTAYHSDGNSTAFDFGSSNNLYLTFIYKCANGAILVFGQYGDSEPDLTKNDVIIISKDVNGDTGIIHAYSIPTVPRFRTSVYSDSGTAAEISTAWNDLEQTQFIPFPTNAGLGNVNYFPNAFYHPIGQLYSMGYGKFTANGNVYLTNGYVSILDE